jgi:hypothetical protein
MTVLAFRGCGSHETAERGREGMEIGVICGPKDRALAEALLRGARERGEGEQPFSALVVAAGRHFLDAPYQANTLEREGPEALVVNLRAFDCVTFVENAVVLAGLIRRGVTDFAAYLEALARIRYRRGLCDGYPSRLHYFTDWLCDNGRKGLVQDITRALGGVPFPKEFHALTDRRQALPGLRDPASFRRMRILEGLCSRRPLSFIPKTDWRQLAKNIREGDLIAITADKRGLDVSHVGIAVRIGGTFHLLHASIAAGQVVLTKGTLAGYLAEKPSRTGIIIGRPMAPGGGKISL